MKSTRVSGVSSIFYPHNLPRRLRLFRIKASEVSNNLFFPSSPIKQLGEKFTDEAIKLGLIPDDEPCDELGGAVITLGNVQDLSPTDEPVIHFMLPIQNALNL